MESIVVDCWGRWKKKGTITLKIGDKVYLTEDKTKLYTIINCNKEIKVNDSDGWEEYSIDLIGKDNDKITKRWENLVCYEDIPIKPVKNMDKYDYRDKIKEILNEARSNLDEYDYDELLQFVDKIATINYYNPLAE